MITYYAHRIPNANPFQEGLGRKTEKGIEPGEITFFLEEDEQKAIGYLEDLKTRYIITDYDSANPEGVFISKVKWGQGNLQGYTADTNNNDVKKVSKYDNSMIARLHILDGRELQNKEKNFYIKSLDHFRLIYESKTTMAFPRQEPDDVIKAVKIFEYVKGARIIGQAEPDTEVSLATEITTNQDRKFGYRKSIITRDGYFEFSAPYSTIREEKKLPKKTDYEVIATPYKLKIGDNEKEINVSEEDVLNGRIIKI
jgi:dolichyl-diphosphooligosaccharide--protein glycosyltransferase